MCAQSLSHIRLFCSPMDCSPHQAPPPMEFSREEHWSRLPFPSPGDLPDPVVELTAVVSPALAGGFFATAPPGKLISSIVHLHSILTSLLTLFLVVQCVRLQVPNAEGTSAIPIGAQIRELRSQGEKNYYYYFCLTFTLLANFLFLLFVFGKNVTILFLEDKEATQLQTLLSVWME